MDLHVCIDGRLIEAPGIGTFLKEMVMALDEHPALRLSILYAPKNRASFNSYSRNNLIAVHSPIFSLQEQLELPFKIPHCDLFWAPHINVPFLPIRAKKRLTTIHDVFHLVHPLPLHKKLAAKLYYGAACRLSDHITTPSAFSEREILRLCPIKPEKLTMIHLGVSSSFRPITSEAVRQKYHLPESYVLTLSSKKPHKNTARLVEAFKGLNCREELVVIGKGVRPIDQADLPAVYSMAKLFVFPSLYEGFGYPPLEAMACGCPVVVSEAASLPEICGSAAEYVDPKRVQSIRAGVERVLNDHTLRRALIEKGHERAAKLQASQAAYNHIQLIGSL